MDRKPNHHRLAAPFGVPPSGGSGKGRSGIQGVQRIVARRFKPWRKYWKAAWSPELGQVARKQFSIRKHGEEKTKRLAIRARLAGLRSIK